MNRRYAAFVAAHGPQPNHEFMAFVDVMLERFAQSRGGTHTPLHPYGLDDEGHEAFTLFIEQHARTFEVAT